MLEGALIGAAVGLVYAIFKVIADKKAKNKPKAEGGGDPPSAT